MQVVTIVNSFVLSGVRTQEQHCSMWSHGTESQLPRPFKSIQNIYQKVHGSISCVRAIYWCTLTEADRMGLELETHLNWSSNLFCSSYENWNCYIRICDVNIWPRILVSNWEPRTKLSSRAHFPYEALHTHQTIEVNLFNKELMLS